MKPKLLLFVCCALEVYAMLAFHRAMANFNDFYFADAASDVEGNDGVGNENEDESDGEETDEGSVEIGTNAETTTRTQAIQKNGQNGSGNSNDINGKSCKGQASEVFVGIVVGTVYAVL